MESRGLDLAWLAGFIDGEGHVGAHPQSHIRGRTYYQAVCFIRNTHEPTMKHVKTLLDRLLDSDLKLAHERRARGKDSFHLNVSSLPRLWRLSFVMLPFAVTKHEQWELIGEYTASRMAATGRKRPYSERELELLARLAVINKRWAESQ